MTPLEELQALADPAKAAEMLAYHKVQRPISASRSRRSIDLADRWRAERTSLDDRLALAAQTSGRPTSTRRASPPQSC